ncbi:MAG TPA: right-handed parallel beta-helix repeat-containing protein, partial [Candidatus Binatia bacterium]|nr:right-handed parallel beta-helix repeat-containing protein [Candidatus Binatia bacterium]
LQGQRNVTIRGMGPATRIIFAPPDPGPPCFLLGKSHDLRLERLLVASRSSAALVRVADCQRVVLAEAILINLTTVPGGAGSVPSGAGVALQDLVTDLQVRECAVLAAKGVTGAGATVRDVAVVRCLLLAAHVGVQLQEVSGLEVRGNRMRGIAPAAWLALASGPPLARATIDGVQDAAGALFTGGLGTQDLALAGVLVFSGRQVTIADNAIVARFGVAGFLLIDARLRDNSILAIAGVALVFALMVHVTGSTVLALAMGLVHGGLAGDLRVEDSTWLGYYGVALFSLGQIAVLLAPLLSGQNIAAAVQQAQSLNGQLAAFGLAAIVRVERNLFASFLTGVLKSERVASADFAIVDNTFLGASRAGVDLGSDHGSALGPVADLLNPRHLIQGNALNVTGVGISSASDRAMILDNSVVAGAAGILVDGAGSTVRGNLVRGRLRAAALVEIHGGATEVVVAANRLEDAPGHGIVVVEPVRRVRIEDNEVRRIGLNAIETATDTVMVSGLSVSGNQIEECGRGPGSAWRRGAIVLGGGLDVRISGNTLRANGAPSDSGFTPIYVEDLVGGAVSDNLVTVNPGGGGPLLSRGSIVLQSARAFVQVQGNRVEGNPGFGLLILERPGADPVQHVQVHGNVFGRATDASPGGAWILEADTATFEGNRVQVLPPPGFPPVPAVAVFGGQVIATGNIVETTGQWGLWVGATGRGIVTSNLSAGILTAGPVL